MVVMNDRPSGPLVGLAYLLATPEALGSLCVIFMCSMSASPPRHSLWHTGQLVALGPPMRELCCWNTTRCCSSFFGGARSTDARRQTGRSFVRASPHQHHHHTTPCYTFVVKFFFCSIRFVFSLFCRSVEPPGIAAWPEDEPQRGDYRRRQILHPWRRETVADVVCV